MTFEEKQWVDGVLERMRELRDKGRYAAARDLCTAAEKERPGRFSDETPRERLAVARALATYKDPELSMRGRLREAQALVDPYVAKSKDPETLGVAGAIERRFYDLDTRVEHLERALAFYLKGHALDAASDWPNHGYTGINASFLHEMLASIEEASGLPLQIEAAAVRRSAAEAICRELLANARGPAENDDEKRYWYQVTRAEAAVGIGDHRGAVGEIEKALTYKPASWMIETTAGQLAKRLRLRRPEGRVSPEGRAVLHALVGASTEAVSSAIRGRLGLALSGGGFRAAFFHLGVLARLAEVDLLRHVEVISCVSGGSLVGALYVLELKHLYESKIDTAIARVDFVKLVARVAKRFQEEVRQNIRTRVAFSVTDNWAMLLGDKSRSHRAAALYEEFLYARVGEEEVRRTAPRYLHELVITPKDTKDFKRSGDNWRLRNKVPHVVFNAATLNTGHSWQFTQESMGEPPAREEDVDVNDRFLRLRFDGAATPRKVRLGDAVAASACVPGLFEPLAIKNVYKDATPLLVDGGVHDNQGTAALLEKDCTAVIVSDASGQMGTIDAPSNSALGSLLRSDSVFQARVREAQYQDLTARVQGGLLHALSFLHLKQGFTRREIGPNGAAPHATAALPYGVSRDVQQCLAGVRTDLDSFSSLESESLMASGYLIAKHDIDPARYEAPAPPPPPPPEVDEFETKTIEGWYEFLRVKDLLKSDSSGKETARRVLDLLSAGGSVAGKVFRVNATARKVGIAALVTAGLAAVALTWTFRDSLVTHLTIGGAALLAITAALRRLRPDSGLFLDALKPASTLKRYLWTSVVAVAGSLLARAHVRWADGAFLAAGDVEPLLTRLRLESGAPAPAVLAPPAPPAEAPPPGAAAG